MSEKADTVQQDETGDVAGDDAPDNDASEERVDALVAEVAQYDEALAAEVGNLEQVVDELHEELESTEEELESTEEELESTEEELESTEEELDEMTDRVKRVQADFKNYKERSKRRLEDEKERATEDLVTRLLDVRDNLNRALEGETDDIDALREGVELTRNEFDRVLDQEGVDEIRPEAGTEVDAQRHEVMMRVPSDEPEGTVAEVYRSGYEMSGKVLRPAQVTISDGSSDGSSDGLNDGSNDEQNDE